MPKKVDAGEEVAHKNGKAISCRVVGKYNALTVLKPLASLG
jgi:hypothetical protein